MCEGKTGREEKDVRGDRGNSMKGNRQGIMKFKEGDYVNREKD